MISVEKRRDDEWYLRRIGEDELVGGTWALLPVRARALIAVGRISPDDAVAIVRAYRRAHTLRGRARENFEPSDDRSTIPDTMRVSTCCRRVQQPWGTVRLDHIVWTGQETRLAAAVTETAPGAGPVAPHMPMRYRGRMFGGGPPSITLVDERGRKHEGHFSGAGSDDEWDGTFTFQPGLAADASWFTIYGERIDLAPNPTDVSVRITPTAPDATPEDLAEQYLTFCLERADQHNADGLDGVDVAIDTLVTTGVLTAQSPTIRGVRAAREALAGNTPFGHRPSRRKASASPDLPARWRSVLDRRGRSDGIVVDRAVSAVTPSFDGIIVYVVALRSLADDFEIDFEARFAPDPLQPQENSYQRFTVSAVDDRDNHYLGEMRGWQGDDDSMSGTIGFGAPLDPMATTVDLQLSSGCSRVLVTVPLHRPDAP